MFLVRASVVFFNEYLSNIVSPYTKNSYFLVKFFGRKLFSIILYFVKFTVYFFSLDLYIFSLDPFKASLADKSHSSDTGGSNNDSNDDDDFEDDGDHHDYRYDLDEDEDYGSDSDSDESDHTVVDPEHIMDFMADKYNKAGQHEKAEAIESQVSFVRDKQVDIASLKTELLNTDDPAAKRHLLEIFEEDRNEMNQARKDEAKLVEEFRRDFNVIDRPGHNPDIAQRIIDKDNELKKLVSDLEAEERATAERERLDAAERERFIEAVRSRLRSAETTGSEEPETSGSEEPGTSVVQTPERSAQTSETTVETPESPVQSSETAVQSSETAVQRPEASAQATEMPVVQRPETTEVKKDIPSMFDDYKATLDKLSIDEPHMYKRSKGDIQEDSFSMLENYTRSIDKLSLEESSKEKLAKESEI